MPGTKARRPVKRSAKIKRKVTRKVKAKAGHGLKARSARKPAAKKRQVIPPHPDQTTVTLGPHRVDHHSVPGGINVHPAPVLHLSGSPHANTVRHH